MTATLDTAYGDGRFETLIVSVPPTDDVGREGDVAIDCASPAKNLYKKIDGTWVFQCALDAGGATTTRAAAHSVLRPPARISIGAETDVEGLGLDSIEINGITYNDAEGEWTLPADATYTLRAYVGVYKGAGAASVFELEWVDAGDFKVGTNNSSAYYQNNGGAEVIRGANVLATALVTAVGVPLVVKLRTTAAVTGSFQVDSIVVEIVERFDPLPPVTTPRPVSMFNAGIQRTEGVVA